MTSSIYLPPPADAPNAAARAACWAASIQPCPTAPHRPRSQAAFNYPFPPLACEGHCWYGLVLPSKLTNVNDVDEPADDEPADVDEPASTAVRRTASTPAWRPERSDWPQCAVQTTLAADCGPITGFSYGCRRCSSCEQPGSRSLRPPPRRAPAERAGASRGLTGAPHDRQKVRVGLSNPPYCLISCPIRPVLCPSDASTAAFPPWQVDWCARKPARWPGMPGPVPGRGAARVGRPWRRAGWR